MGALVPMTGMFWGLRAVLGMIVTILLGDLLAVPIVIVLGTIVTAVVVPTVTVLLGRLLAVPTVIVPIVVMTVVVVTVVVVAADVRRIVLRFGVFFARGVVGVRVVLPEKRRWQENRQQERRGKPRPASQPRQWSQWRQWSR